VQKAILNIFCLLNNARFNKNIRSAAYTVKWKSWDKNQKSKANWLKIVRKLFLVLLLLSRNFWQSSFASIFRAIRISSHALAARKGNTRLRRSAKKTRHISSAALRENPICLRQKCQNQNIHHTLAFVPPHSLSGDALALGEEGKKVCVYADFLGHATKGAGEIASRHSPWRLQQPGEIWRFLQERERACRQLLGIVRFLSRSLAWRQPNRPGSGRARSCSAAASGGLSTKYQSPGGCANWIN